MALPFEQVIELGHDVGLPTQASSDDAEPAQRVAGIRRPPPAELDEVGVQGVVVPEVLRQPDAWADHLELASNERRVSSVKSMSSAMTTRIILRRMLRAT